MKASVYTIIVDKKAIRVIDKDNDSRETFAADMVARFGRERISKITKHKAK